MVVHLALSESPHQTKDGLIRSLSESQCGKKKKEVLEDPPVNVLDHEDEEDLSSRYIHLVSPEERLYGNFREDHGYSKPFNWRPDHPLSKPTKTLFIPRSIRDAVPFLHSKHRKEPREVVDVLSMDKSAASLPGSYDYEKATKFMTEPDRFVSFANPGFSVAPDKEDTDWDEASIPKDHWTSAQSRLFNKALKILNADRLSRLATEGVTNEPVLRRLSADKSAKRFRFILSEIHWDHKLTRWLHETFCEHLPKYYIASYLEILQSLRVKIPSLVDKMTSGKLPMDISSQLAKEGLQLLIKRPWDPVVTSLGEHNIKKLPNNPLLILICKESWTSRSKRWALMLSHLGKLVVLDYSSEDSKKMTVSAYLHHMITQTIAKIRELKRNNPERPFILLGWGSVASVACQVAAMESVAVIVCLGFPVYTLDGFRGEADDPIMDLKTSILFLIGQNSLLCRSDDIEDMRERMKAETGLVIVGEADDSLRVSKTKKSLEGITQSMVDRCLIDEIREFAANVLRAPPPLPACLLNDPISLAKNDSNGIPLIPASPLVSASFGDGSKSGRKTTPRPRKKPDKPKKPKALSKVIYNIPVNPDCSGILKHHQQSSLKVIAPSASCVSPSLFRPQSKMSADDLIRNHKKLESISDKMNKFIELPMTPLKPSEALKHMTNSPSINSAPPNIAASLSLTNSPQFSPGATLASRHVIQHPGIRAAGLKTVSSIPHLVCPPAVKGPITIKKPIVCSSTNALQGSIAFNPPSDPLPIRTVSALSPGKTKEDKFCILTLPSSHHQHTSSPSSSNQSPSKLTETIKLVNKYLPKAALGDVPKDKDRRNVAEILASLSSLQPEPNKTLTTLAVSPFNPTTSSPNVSPIVSSKFVKVIQTTTGSESLSVQTTSSGTARFRKQVFVTNTSSSKELPEDGSLVVAGGTLLSVDEDTLSSSPKVFEQDILEEDFGDDDLDYKPYAKKSKPGVKNKKSK